MKTYHKIQTVFKRDPATKFKTLLDGDWALPEFGVLANNQWVGTEKVDGTNIRAWLGDDGKIVFGGRKENSTIPKYLLPKLYELLDTEAFHTLKNIDDFILFGEGFGNKIQKAGKHYGEVDFILFDVYHKPTGNWLKRLDVDHIAQRLDVAIVPVVFRGGTLHEAIEVVKAGQESTLGNLTSEGLILTPVGDFKTRDGKRVITKIKHKDFK